MNRNIPSEKQKSIVSILKAIPRQTLNFSSRTILYTAALSSAAFAITNVDPSTLSPTISFFLTGLGVEAIGTLLDKITSKPDITIEDIREEIEQILSESNIQEALQNPKFIAEFTDTFTNHSLQIIRALLKSKEGDLAVELVQELVGTNLLIEKTSENLELITMLLSRSDLKRDEQYDDIIDRIDQLVQIVKYQAVLSLYPRTPRPLFDIPLVGREDDLNWLNDKADQLKDCLIVGQPGSGKSFLFRKLADKYRAFFVVGGDRSQLEQSIMYLRPQILFLDDAHIYSDILLDLQQIRRHMDSHFAIFVNCWPSKQSRVKAQLHLPSEDVRELSLLSLDELVVILKAIDVVEPWEIVHEIVRQAEGRPGLAVTLGDLYKKGGHVDIFSGDAVTNLAMSH